jgi:hypothetical protein
VTEENEESEGEYLSSLHEYDEEWARNQEALYREFADERPDAEGGKG